MKSLLLLGFGGLCGILATVLFFTVDPDFDGTDAEGAGGGNVTLTLNEEALASLVAAEVAKLPGFGEKPLVIATVGANGIIKFDFTIGGLGAGLRSSLTVNPDIVDGQLHLAVVDSRLGELALPDELASVLERPVQEKLESLAGGPDYRLTAIRTTDHRLALEIQIKV